MKSLLRTIQLHYRKLYSAIILLVSWVIILMLFPRHGQFPYEFQQGQNWKYDDLVAQIDFPIYKTAKELQLEQDTLKKNFPIYIRLDDEGNQMAMEALAQERAKYEDDSAQLKLFEILKQVIVEVHQKGVISERNRDLWSEKNLLLLKGIEAVPVTSMTFKTSKEWEKVVVHQLDSLGLTIESSLLSKLLLENLIFDRALTEASKSELINKVLPTKDKISKGEVIIFKNSLIDEAKFQVLTSYQESFVGNFGKTNEARWRTLAGQGILIALLLAMLYLFFLQFRAFVLENPSNLTLILFNVVAMVALAKWVLDLPFNWLYVTPFPILPIILRSFYDTRSALFVHLITVLFVGYLAPNGYEFYFIQFVAGIYSIISVSGLYRRSQLFLASVKITGVYIITYIGFVLVREDHFDVDHAYTIGQFALNGLLSLFAYPLIYIYEKMFGLVSDITLLELGDTNSPLLRELSQKAPGTFQHSLQVANLAESAAVSIGGNAMLVRTGALYHDIGKMNRPLYFVENQTTGINPHDELRFEESAVIIIGHVLDGIKMAKDHRLPDKLIDFIRTHHGTSRVEYFYRQFLKNYPEEDLDTELFTYPGPKPFSKETAILMMADGVEAASRSLNKPTAELVNELVEKIIARQMETGQFDNADITLSEISKVKEIFKKKLLNIYHLRIAYPD